MLLLMGRLRIRRNLKRYKIGPDRRKVTLKRKSICSTFSGEGRHKDRMRSYLRLEAVLAAHERVARRGGGGLLVATGAIPEVRVADHSRDRSTLRVTINCIDNLRDRSHILVFGSTLLEYIFFDLSSITGDREVRSSLSITSKFGLPKDRIPSTTLIPHDNLQSMNYMVTETL